MATTKRLPPNIDDAKADLYDVCRQLAAIRSGPTPNRTPEWVAKILDLTAAAERAVRKAKGTA